MIRWPAGVERLPADERFGLETLIDLSRLVPVEGDVAGDLLQLELDDVPALIDVRRSQLDGWRLRQRDGHVGVPRQLLRLVTEIGGAAAEQRSTATDHHGRVPAQEHPLVQLGLEREPVLSQIGLALREAAMRAAGNRPLRLVAPWPEGRRWAVALTHDLDIVDWWPAFTALRLAELARKGEVVDLVRTVAAAARWTGGSPVWAGVLQLLGAEADRGVTSTWFVISGAPTWKTAASGDITYDLNGRRGRKILDALVRAGQEVGLHGSFATMDDEAAMAGEKERLAALIGGKVAGIRQHYLRMRPGATQRMMRASRFAYDATYGFSDRNGFRLGAADILAGWDAREGRESGLAEVPLTWMDRALSKYKGIEDPHRWVDDALELAEKVRMVGGLWVGLWHPNMTDPLGFPGAPRAFPRLIDGLKAGGPHVAPLRELVEWRLARRRVRIRAAGADGAFRAVLSGRSWPSMSLEDAAGRGAEAIETG
jgi:hypothetical protein